MGPGCWVLGVFCNFRFLMAFFFSSFFSSFFLVVSFFFSWSQYVLHSSICITHGVGGQAIYIDDRMFTSYALWYYQSHVPTTPVSVYLLCLVWLHHILRGYHLFGKRNFPHKSAILGL